MRTAASLLAAALLLTAGAAFAGKFTGATPPAKDDAKKDDAKAPSKLPVLKAPVLFNTPDADALLARMQVFPKDNPWNQDVSKLPVLRNSREMIAAIGADLPFAFNWDMGFVIVPPNQPKIDVRIKDYPDESDKGPYPVPDCMPIEGWPISGGTLDAIQRATGGDRHGIVVDPYAGRLYEFYQARKVGGGWEAAQASIFDLASNRLRPDGWTSSDAAGLPIFPSIVRFDEVERGMVNHAMRFTVQRTRRAYVRPATHFASRLSDPNLPRMGERFRLRADFDVSRFSKHAQAVLNGLKKYGMFVADNGGNWRLSVAPDKRIQGLDELRKVKGSDFEVVDTEAH